MIIILILQTKFLYNFINIVLSTYYDCINCMNLTKIDPILTELENHPVFTGSKN